MVVLSNLCRPVHISWSDFLVHSWVRTRIRASLVKVFCFKVWSWTKDNQLADLTIRALRIKTALTVEVGRDGVPCQEAVDRNLIDDMEQQEGHTGEAEGLQQTPCVAWKRKRGGVGGEQWVQHSLSGLALTEQKKFSAGYFLKTQTTQHLQLLWMARIQFCSVACLAIIRQKAFHSVLEPHEE